MKVKILSASLVMILAVALSACGGTGQNNQAQGQKDKEAAQASGKTAPKSLLVPLENQKGQKVGKAQLVQTSDGVKITLEARGLTPGEHAVHIHETGKCVPPTFRSAGGHFNPFESEHGLDNPKGAHAGDLPNITVPENGSVESIILAKNVTLKKGKRNSLLDQDGSALVIHAGKDDNHSQPSGDAGDRVICGVISN